MQHLPNLKNSISSLKAYPCGSHTASRSVSVAPCPSYPCPRLTVTCARKEWKFTAAPASTPRYPPHSRSIPHTLASRCAGRGQTPRDREGSKHRVGRPDTHASREMWITAGHVRWHRGIFLFEL